MNPVSPDKNLSEKKSECNVVRLPSRKDFLRLRTGRRYSTSNFTLQAKATDSSRSVKSLPDPICRVGYTVTTRTGNAVVRNRIKRRLRAAVEQVFPGYGKAAHDYAVIARRNVLTEEFSTIKQDLKRALDHVHRNRAKGNGN